MAQRPSALREKALGLTDAWGHAQGLLGLLLRGFGLRGWNRSLGKGCRAVPDESHQPCGPRHADPRAAASVPQERAVDAMGANPCPAVSSRARAIRVEIRIGRFRNEHWIRHAHPESDSSVPFDENLPMGMSAESIG
jgi:hypothetical protein